MAEAITPLRQQYLEIKRQYPETIVFFRLGDFYETFDEDAQKTSEALDIVLTSRPVAKGVRVPMAGIPFHAVENYLGRLIESIDDPDAVEAFLDRGRTGTRAIPGKHGSLPADWAEVVVEIPDAPGSLARLFADVEAAGVNVEDVTIDHDTQAERGWLAVHVEATAAEPLTAAMTAAGWNVRPTA